MGQPTEQEGRVEASLSPLQAGSGIEGEGGDP